MLKKVISPWSERIKNVGIKLYKLLQAVAILDEKLKILISIFFNLNFSII